MSVVLLANAPKPLTVRDALERLQKHTEIARGGSLEADSYYWSIPEVAADVAHCNAILRAAAHTPDERALLFMREIKRLAGFAPENLTCQAISAVADSFLKGE